MYFGNSRNQLKLVKDATGRNLSTGKGNGAGGDGIVKTDSEEVTSFKRSFTVRNGCSQTIRIGSTGGR